MRPTTWDEFIGQEQILGPGKPLRRALEKDEPFSLILWGPPGCGKTSLARLVQRLTRHHFAEFSAVTSGVAEVRRLVEEARRRLESQGQRTILFVDEIHRFNKAQQDAFLPWVEAGTVVLLGATTENPHFYVISPLLSRTRVYALKPLGRPHLARLLEWALKDPERGLGLPPVRLDDGVADLLLEACGGDARRLLNSLEVAASLAPVEEGCRRVRAETIRDVLHTGLVRYDRQGEDHYNTISAFIKSVRASDPDAALHYLARMLEAGEDPLFVARRLVILASEDVGNADPHALMVAVAALQALERIGMPEGRIPLAQATTYLACAPKSNASYLALEAARADLDGRSPPEIPLHLRNAAFPGARRLGYGVDYAYPHDHPGHFAGQPCLPEGWQDRVYYRPSDQGVEQRIGERLKKLWPERHPR
ncbi:MAG TPA: replication-associated recombination protein A [Candidatus Nitrosotenuis sp.]|jgi:putative ATPase|nr:replication-associated recombination protein A [Candidatus Nitrosotenuis sp.]